MNNENEVLTALLASPSDADLLQTYADGELTAETAMREMDYAITIVNQLTIVNLFLALILGCVCAFIFSRYIRG